MKNPMTLPSLCACGAIASIAILVFGCDASTDNQSGSWINSDSSGSTTAPAANTSNAAKPATRNEANHSGSTASTAYNTTASGGSAADPAVVATAPDEVPYGALSWRYGGVSGGGYQQSGVEISNLKTGRNDLSFKYKKDLSAWGYGHGDASAYACMFVQTANGSWVGGKFDWISSSRSSRDLKNVTSGYGGWSLAGVPNPCRVAFVILDPKSKRRSNVIAGSWSR